MTSFSVELNSKLQQHPTLKAIKSTLQHDEDPVAGTPGHAQRFQGWYSIGESEKIKGEISSTKAGARESAAEKMIAYIEGRPYNCKRNTGSCPPFSLTPAFQSTSDSIAHVSPNHPLVYARYQVHPWLDYPQYIPVLPTFGTQTTYDFNTLSVL